MSKMFMKEHRKKKILIADDEKLIVDVLAKVLELDGYDVHGVYNNFDSGQEIIEQIHTGTYDLLLTDITRPKPNGLELTWRIRSEGFNLPIIIMTGHGIPENIIKAMDLGANFIIHKPFNLTTFLSTIYNFLGQGNITQTKYFH